MAGHIEEIYPGIYLIDAIRFANAINVLAVSGVDGWTLFDTGLAGSPGPAAPGRGRLPVPVAVRGRASRAC